MCCLSATPLPFSCFIIRHAKPSTLFTLATLLLAALSTPTTPSLAPRLSKNKMLYGSLDVPLKRSLAALFRTPNVM